MEELKQAEIFLSNLFHAYAQTDGTYNWPNSREGDMLKHAQRVVKQLIDIRKESNLPKCLQCGKTYNHHKMFCDNKCKDQWYNKIPGMKGRASP